MVTVGYEQARGLRKKHQRPEGFQVSASRTVAVPIAVAFAAIAAVARAWMERRIGLLRGGGRGGVPALPMIGDGSALAEDR